MFRIRKIFDDKSVINQDAIEQIKTIIGEQFELVVPEELEKLNRQIVDPVYFQYRPILFVVEGFNGKINGFALLLHFSDLNTCFLEWISTTLKDSGRGIGSILYEVVRNECQLLKVPTLFMEVLPDEAHLCPYPVEMEQNKKRIKFYERYGARVVLNNQFKVEVKSEENDLIFLICDPLDNENLQISKAEMQGVVRAILERKYKGECSPDYSERVIESFADDPVLFRPARYTKAKEVQKTLEKTKLKHIPLFVNRDHQIHHIREKGYVEAPTRVTSIFNEISKLNLFEEMKAKKLPSDILYRVHDKEYINFLKTITKELKEGEVYYPEIFPLRNRARLPKDIRIQTGYFCLDSFTPLHKNVLKASLASAECAYSAALYMMAGHRVTYALCRPPGHHAEKGVFGGFCYINSAAIAAEYISQFGKVAILDIDYHHGNGTQSIFYNRADVLTISIHGDPQDAFPYFAGFKDELGEADGLGCNLNLPLPEKIDLKEYSLALETALEKIKEFGAEYLVISLGLDIAHGDPTGTWSFFEEDFKKIGSHFKNFELPIVIVQEGGYHQKNLGKSAKAFFEGIHKDR